jgi:hypothetical protein
MTLLIPLCKELVVLAKLSAKNCSRWIKALTQDCCARYNVLLAKACPMANQNHGTVACVLLCGNFNALDGKGV